MALPTFIVIGAAKAGTTSIYAYMKQHPEICVSDVKETNFFAYGDPYIEGNWPHLEWPVTTLEDYELQFSDCRGRTIIGESSPIYLHSQKAADRIRQAIPSVRLIVSLRNPIDRAISGYFMHVRGGVGKGDFSDFDFDMRYVKDGFYSDLLAAYLSRFEREGIKICLFDDLESNPTAFMCDLYAFVGANPDFVPDTAEAYNVGSAPRSIAINTLLINPTLRRRIAPIFPKSLRRVGKALLQWNRTTPPPFPDGLREKLQDHYGEEIDRLQTLTGLDLSRWTHNS